MTYLFLQKLRCPKCSRILGGKATTKKNGNSYFYYYCNDCKLTIKGNTIKVLRIDGYEYISLTDLAKTQNDESPADVVKNWMRNKETLSFLGVWEELNNENFKLVEFDQFKNEAGRHAFTMSPQKWIRETNAIGVISKSGKYGGGTYARSDIAFEFASWISPEFKLYLIKEFERLKRNENYQYKIEWNANRILSKVNYVVHTDAIKNFIVPTLTEEQKKFVYSEEADVLNVALFGMTAKEWRNDNPKLAKNGNIRDYTDLLHLVILSNLETINASLILDNVSQKERLIKLNNNARMQMQSLKNNKNIKELELLQNKINDKALIESK